MNIEKKKIINICAYVCMYLGCPGPLDEAGPKHLLPPVQTLDIRSIRDKARYLLPTLSAVLMDRWKYKNFCF